MQLEDGEDRAEYADLLLLLLPVVGHAFPNRSRGLFIYNRECMMYTRFLFALNSQWRAT